MRRDALALVALVPALIWGPAELTGRLATAKAGTLGPGCWALRDPADFTALRLTRDPRAPFRFWSNANDPQWEVTRPHFAFILPDAPHDAYALGWSFRRMDFWHLDIYQTDFHGLAFAQEDCRALLATG